MRPTDTGGAAFAHVLAIVLAATAQACGASPDLSTAVVDVHADVEMVGPVHDVEHTELSDVAPTDVEDTGQPYDLTSDVVGGAGDASAGDDEATSDSVDALDVVDASVDDGPGLEADTGAEPDVVPLVTPLDCPSLPPMCPLKRTSHVAVPFWPLNQPTTKFNDPGISWQNASKAHAFYSGSAPSLFSLWRPVSIVATGSHAVRIHASWYNQYWWPDPMPAPKWPTQAGFGCRFLKPSLMPSGCVVIDIDTKLHAVTTQAHETTTPGMFNAEDLNVLDAIRCSQFPYAPASDLPLSVTLADGTHVIAHPGRASVHLLQTDPLADISPLVRDLPTATTTDVSTAPVVEVVPPTEATSTGVSVDVSVCHATGDQIAASGCECPMAPWPDPAALPESGTWLRLSYGGETRLLTPAFISSVEAKGWDGTGYLKVDGTGKDEWTTTCCLQGCPIEWPNWVCAGWKASKWATWALAEVELIATRYLEFEIRAPSADIPDVLPAILEAPKSDVGHFFNALAGRDVPARLRDGVVDDHYGASESGPAGKDSIGTFELKSWGAASATFEVTHAGTACRRHFYPVTANVGTTPTSPCQPVPAKLEGHIEAVKPE